MGGGVEELVIEGTDAVRRGDGDAARAAFEAALEQTTGGELLDGLAQSLYIQRDYLASIDAYERAYAAYRDEGNALGAVRVARVLGFLHSGIRGDGAVGQGWGARALSLLSGEADTAERGWIELHIGMFEGDRQKKNQHLRAALEIARRFGDADLEFEAMAYLGASLVHDDKTEQGMMLLDEALAAVAGGEVKGIFATEEIFCQLFSACEYAHDVTRADQWIRVGEEIATRRNAPAVSAFCRTHYGALLTAAGRWAEADAELSEAVRIWSQGYLSLRWMALVRLADLRVRQGRIEEAEQLLEGLDVYTEAARPLAAVHLAKGNIARAVDVLERALEQIDPESVAAGALWALLVDGHLAGGAVGDAEAAAARLGAIAQRHPAPYLSAASALAQGQVCMATGSGDPRACLREALAGFGRARLPMELGRARLELAQALTSESPEVAMAEARAALEAFERLEAARLADAAAALVRALGGQARTGPKGHNVLTKREAEVLELIGHGLSNPEISDRLYISRKTVEHHVGRILSKLSLRSRAEAAAYAARSAAASS
jgi:DNA-binding CsgD family transcriptional regulator